MRLHVLSDLHLSVAPLAPPATDADVVVLAGDIARPAAAIEWASGFAKPVVYVAGNHEFYGSSIDATLTELRRCSEGTAVRFLEHGEAVIAGVRFLGATMWSDFGAAGDGDAQRQAIALAERLIRDFARIRRREGEEAPFGPADAIARFGDATRWLAGRLAAPFDGPTVVVTHHAPSLRSIHPRFAGSPINAAFVSDAEPLVAASGAALWIHGHTHDSFDYRVGDTRVLCNPRGYAKNGAVENAAFEAARVVEVNR